MVGKSAGRRRRRKTDPSGTLISHRGSLVLKASQSRYYPNLEPPVRSRCYLSPWAIPTTAIVARSLMFEVRHLLARLGLNDGFLRLGEGEERLRGWKVVFLAGFGGVRWIV